ncbi:MAG: FAD binding domain-containing protein [Deltaproteobacteria bacterium]|nr:FAD binding domain-containing protein [Deltaproteobacteria bacterium]
MTTAYYQPERLEVALRLVARGAQPLAGATALFTGKSRPEGELVDITGLGLSNLEVEPARIALGATCTLAKISDAEELPGMEGALLRRAARAVGSRPLRNAITLGGNIAQVAFWADMPVVLLALDAQLEIAKAAEASQVVDLATALQGKRPWEGGLITKIFVPRRQATCGFGYERFARTANDYPFATVCVTFRRDGAVAREVRVVVGALQPRSFRVPEVEQMIEGKGTDPALVEGAGKKLSEVVTVAPNFRASADYRRELAGVLCKRALESAFTWAMREA